MLSDFFTARTLFHVHTIATDGKLSCDEYFDFALENRVDRIIFLEHIRQDPTYCPLSFARQIGELEQRTGVPASVGFEAKVLGHGELDISDDALKVAAVVGIAEHGKQLTFAEFRQSFLEIIDRYPRQYPQQVFVWVHPGLLLVRTHELDTHRGEYHDLLLEAVDRGVQIERNLRYGLVSDETQGALPSLQPIFGVDGHSAEDLVRWLKVVGS